MADSEAPRWEHRHGKLWLVLSHEGTRYEVPVDPESRYVDGMVLFGDEEDPPLVKGMMAWSRFEPILAQVPEAQRELERCQAPAILAQGGTLDRTRPEEAYHDLPAEPD